MLKSLLILMSLALLTLVVGGFFLSNTYEVERSVFVRADKSAIYADLATPKTWPEWSFWKRDLDPNAKWTFEGPETGAGASVIWDGDPKLVGSGELHIVAADPERGIEYQLGFNHGDYTTRGSLRLEPGSAGTRVVWKSGGDFGKKPIGGWVKLVLGSLMEAQLARPFQQSLDQLKQRAEAKRQ